MVDTTDKAGASLRARIFSNLGSARSGRRAVRPVHASHGEKLVCVAFSSLSAAGGGVGGVGAHHGDQPESEGPKNPRPDAAGVGSLSHGVVHLEEGDLSLQVREQLLFQFRD